MTFFALPVKCDERGVSGLVMSCALALLFISDARAMPPRPSWQSRRKWRRVTLSLFCIVGFMGSPRFIMFTASPLRKRLIQIQQHVADDGPRRHFMRLQPGRQR